MDSVRSYFGTNEPLTSWTLLSSLFSKISTDQHWSGKKVRTKVFNWSEVHLYRSNFLQNPYFNTLWDSATFKILIFTRVASSRPYFLYCQESFDYFIYPFSNGPENINDLNLCMPSKDLMNSPRRIYKYTIYGMQ